MVGFVIWGEVKFFFKGWEGECVVDEGWIVIDCVCCEGSNSCICVDMLVVYGFWCWFVFFKREECYCVDKFLSWGDVNDDNVVSGLMVDKKVFMVGGGDGLNLGKEFGDGGYLIMVLGLFDL